MIQKGFTLIELLVVIVIIAVVMSAAAFGLQGVRDNTRDDKRVTDTEKMRSGFARYLADCNRYPSQSEFNNAMANGSLFGNPDYSTACRASNSYIEEFPQDPESPVISYYYDSQTTPKDVYILCISFFEDPDINDNTRVATECGSCGGRACNAIFDQDKGTSF